MRTRRRNCVTPNGRSLTRDWPAFLVSALLTVGRPTAYWIGSRRAVRSCLPPSRHFDELALSPPPHQSLPDHSLVGGNRRARVGARPETPRRLALRACDAHVGGTRHLSDVLHGRRSGARGAR